MMILVLSASSFLASVYYGPFQLYSHRGNPMYFTDVLHPVDLGLILSYKCQAACAHCLYNCNPEWKDWMSPGEVRTALEATMEWGERFQVHITGGEPFLNFPLLLHAVRIASELGISNYLETNAGWCVRGELVEDRFLALRDAGLGAVLISCSPFHAEMIPFERTLLAIQKALEIFGRRGVIVYLSEWLDQIQSLDKGGTTDLEEYVATYGAQNAGRMFWEGYGLISGGRSGYRLGHLMEGRQASHFQGVDCRREILYSHHSHFDLYGNFISGFCGGLTVGDWHTLPELRKRFQGGNYPKLISILMDEGPFGLFNFAQREYEYLPLEGGYAGKCHIWLDVRRHLVQLADFPELKPREFYERF
jgi:hypothetical protein